MSAHLDDGRGFVKSTGRMYDLATYALVDSLVPPLRYSSLRLESFLFTEEAFRDIKAKLKPGGAFVMYNAYRQGWVDRPPCRAGGESIRHQADCALDAPRRRDRAGR